LLVLFGYLLSIVASQLSLELRRRSIQVLGQLPIQIYTDLPSLGDGVYVCGVNPFWNQTTTTLMWRRWLKLSYWSQWNRHLNRKNMFHIWYRNPRFGKKNCGKLWEIILIWYMENLYFLWEINFLEVSLARFLIWCGRIVYEIGILYLDKWYQVIKLLLLHVYM
jgi:light-independent protochlorophyllide reductase subunit N